MQGIRMIDSQDSLVKCGCFFHQRQRVTVPPRDFRNILENVIARALTLYKDVRVEPDENRDDFLLKQEMKKKVGTLLSELRQGNYRLIERIFSTRKPCVIIMNSHKPSA